MSSVIHKKSIITLIVAILLSPALIYFAAYADEDPSVTYSTPLLPGVADYSLDGDVTLDVNVAAVNALEITLSTTRIALELVPGMVESGFDSKDLTIKVGTTNDTGYTLTMIPSYDNTSTTSLTRTEAINNTTPVIETITNSVSAETFSSTADTTTINRWGFRLGETNLDVNKTLYNPVQITNEINNSTTAISNDQTTISFAAKASNELPAGNYRTTLKFTAVANPLLPVCNPSATDIADAVCLQDFSENGATIAGTMTSNIQYTLYDNRDWQEYTIAKVADGKVWMTENLNLAGGVTVTSADSNVVNDYTLPSSNAFGFASTNTGIANVYNSGTRECNDSSPSPCYSYYSFRAATAGVYSYGVNSYDICPKGWRMPTSSENTALKNAYSNFTNLRNGAYKAVMSGYFNDNSGFSANVYYGQWSSTAYSSNLYGAYVLWYNNKYPGGYDATAWGDSGFSVRCLVK